VNASSVHDPRIARPFRENRFTQAAVLAYGAVFTWSAISPKYPSDWWLEMLLAFVFIAVLIATHRRFVFSNFSALLIASFLALHTYGAHYTYAESSFGDWLKEALSLSRNHYDRIVHFAFGLLMAYPLRELARRVLHLRGGWSFALPWLTALALSGGYEILEGWAARIVSPELGTAYLGTQGDEWDAQKDMSLANSGSLIALALTALYLRATGHEPWTLLAPRPPA
jgi:putative membrane protein